MPEKRDGMEKWDEFVTALLSKKRPKIGVREGRSADAAKLLDTL
jgi:hypothetical protein